MIYNIILFLFISCGNALCAENADIPEKIFSDASSMIFENRYENALKLIEKYISANPGEPAGYLLKATILNYEFIDLEDRSIENEFENAVNMTYGLASEKLKTNPGDLWAQYYLYSAQTLKGSMEAASGSFLRGIVRSRSGALGLMKIIEKDPAFYDAYLASGSYRFWKGKATGPLSGLLNGSSQKGINEVKIAVEKGRLSGDLSRSVLIEMLLEYNPGEAVSEALKMREKYPHSRLFLWQLGEGYKKLERFNDAEKVFSTLAASFDETTVLGIAGELRCSWKLAVLAKKVGKNDRCIYYCKNVLKLGKNPDVFKLQNERIGKAEKMLKEMIK